MVNIIDRRHKKNTSAGNRKKFIERYKSQIKSRVDELAKGKSIKSFGEKEKIDIKGTDEPTFRHRSNSGKRQIVVPGNDKLRKGDTIDKQSSGKSGGAGPGEDSLDDFSFVLTKKEFLDIYFQGMKLPNFIKKAVFGSKKTTLKRAGYTKVGIPARLNLKKTMENAIARRIATKKKTPYLDDIDLRYNYFKEEPVPLNKAVMICLMDVSGSMQEREKTIAKKFFLLLYLFLEKNYEAVTLHFVTYTDIAYEVSENEFFYGQRTGGTLISSALELCDKIITENYQIATNNI